MLFTKTINWNVTNKILIHLKSLWKYSILYHNRSLQPFVLLCEIPILVWYKKIRYDLKYT